MEKLYKRHFRALGRYGFCISSDPALIEDAIQDIFVALWRQREYLHEVDHVGLFLFRALRDQLEYTLNPGTFQGSEDIDDFLDYLSVLSSGDYKSGRELRPSRIQAIQDALSHLSNRQREAVHLRFYQGFGLTEAAETMGLSEPIVQGLLSRSYAVLRVTLRAVISLSVISILVGAIH